MDEEGVDPRPWSCDNRTTKTDRDGTGPKRQDVTIVPFIPFEKITLFLLFFYWRLKKETNKEPV